MPPTPQQATGNRQQATGKQATHNIQLASSRAVWAHAGSERRGLASGPPRLPALPIEAQMLH
eukprot:9820667-Lingulodinium_polyedra.AAC.1